MPWLILGALGLLFFAAKGKASTSSGRTFVNGMPIDANAPPEIVALVNQRIAEVPYTYEGAVQLGQLLAGTAAGLGPVYPKASAAVWARLSQLEAQFPQWFGPQPA